jgi:GAF domain/Pyridoxamine 5'-phosphate oxidase
MSTPSPLTVPLEDIASCFEGIIPSTICSCARDGTPNLTYLSIVHRLDDRHVGLSYQFFSKTRRNIMENPMVQVVVVSPETQHQYRLNLCYERTETEGPTFAHMKSSLDAVASQTGMSKVFRLRGVDIYRVLDCRPFNSQAPAEASPKTDPLPELEAFSERLAACGDLDSLLDTALDALSNLFGIDHSFVMALDEAGTRLYTLASHGYADSGEGSEVWVGEGILGVAAERRVVVRTTSVAREMIFSRAVRSTLQHRDKENLLEKEITLPGLPNVQSQLVAPLVARGRLSGVLCLQSVATGRFLAGDERLIQIAARHLAATMAMLARSDARVAKAAPSRRRAAPSQISAIIKHYGEDDSIFIDDAYLIKGVAGRIFWKLVQSHARTGRTDFTNKEIRLDRDLKLPDIKDNLEARLILLRRRLESRCDFLRLVRLGRGQFHLEVQRELTLEEHVE